MNKVEYEKERRLIAQAYAIYYQQKISMDREIVVAVFDNISEVPAAWDTNYRDFMARVYKKDFALVYRDKKIITEQENNLFHEIQDKWGILKSSPINSFLGRVYQFHD